MIKLPGSTLPFILHFVKQRWFLFSILILTSFIWAVDETIFPYFLKLIVNHLEAYQGDRSEVFHSIKTILILIVLVWTATEVALRVQGILQIYIFPRFRASIRNAVFNYVKQHSHEYFSNEFAGNIAKKISDLPTSCHEALEIICLQFITGIVGTVSVLVLMWLINPLFSLVILGWLFLHFGSTFLFMRYGNISWERHADAVSTLNAKIIDVFTNISNLRLFSRGQYESQYLESFQREEIHKARHAMWLIEIMRIGMGISGLLMLGMMFFLLLYGWINQWVSLGDFAQVGMQAFWLLNWMWFLTYEISHFVKQTGIIGDALKLIQKNHDVVDACGASTLKVTQGEVRFENVGFAYNENRAVFENFNITIPAKQKIGLVGFSGSGKTTFVNLILRFYDVQKGKILIDGQDIAQVTQDSLRSQIAMIPQDPSLYHRTLMENIRYGRVDATDEEVIHAAKLAHCHEFIEQLEQGYQSLVGERGVKLSGGQRQRIAIARAILKDAPILILDEATSSLDSVTEKTIQQSLHQLMRDKTTIVIAHRLSTLNNMDKILVFDKGKIVEEGTKEALLKKQGHFALLWNMQTDGFLPEKDKTTSN